MDYGRPVQFGYTASALEEAIEVIRLFWTGGIDDAARAAGRDPSAIRRVLNVGGDLTADDFTTLVLEHGFDTIITSPVAGEAFIEDVVPKVRELVAEGRESH